MKNIRNKNSYLISVRQNIIKNILTFIFLMLCVHHLHTAKPVFCSLSDGTLYFRFDNRWLLQPCSQAEFLHLHILHSLILSSYYLFFSVFLKNTWLTICSFPCWNHLLRGIQWCIIFLLTEWMDHRARDIGTDKIRKDVC